MISFAMSDEQLPYEARNAEHFDAPVRSLNGSAVCVVGSNGVMTVLTFVGRDYTAFAGRSLRFKPAAPENGIWCNDPLAGRAWTRLLLFEVPAVISV